MLDTFEAQLDRVLGPACLDPVFAKTGWSRWYLFLPAWDSVILVVGSALGLLSEGFETFPCFAGQGISQDHRLVPSPAAPLAGQFDWSKAGRCLPLALFFTQIPP